MSDVTTRRPGGLQLPKVRGTAPSRVIGLDPVITGGANTDAGRDLVLFARAAKADGLSERTTTVVFYEIFRGDQST